MADERWWGILVLWVPKLTVWVVICRVEPDRAPGHCQVARTLFPIAPALLAYPIEICLNWAEVRRKTATLGRRSTLSNLAPIESLMSSTHNPKASGLDLLKAQQGGWAFLFSSNCFREVFL